VKTVFDPRYIEIVARIRAARKSKGISQFTLGEMLGKPQSFISKIENCERKLDLIEALNICDALDVQLSHLIPSEMKRIYRNE